MTDFCECGQNKQIEKLIFNINKNVLLYSSLYIRCREIKEEEIIEHDKSKALLKGK